MQKLRKIEYELLFELTKNPRNSDRRLSKILGVSQATISRTRARLEKSGLLEYGAILNLEKLGIEIMAFTFTRLRSEKSTEPMNKVKEFIQQLREQCISRYPNIIFACGGRGLGMTGVIISVHRDYADYVQFEREFRGLLGEYMDRFDTFLVSLKDKPARELTFKYLGDYLKELQI
ncbi:MAG: Lrp/AsnC family transcriptional regulator [Candidatus Bathyarchaeota archaeon]|jgi:DNA-binding Lrp family transcriptional regulator